MVKIPLKFRRIAAAFDEAAREARSCDGSSSGGDSEHSADLSDLVNSFLENEIGSEERTADEYDEDADGNEFGDDHESDQSNCNPPGYDAFQNSLKKLFHPENRDRVRRRIHREVEKALRELPAVESTSPEFKRRMMSRLRNRGFDAGLCKSKWQKNGQRPSGEHEYIDVNAGGGIRYIVEVFLAGEFTIARPADCYASLLDAFPLIFVGKPDDLKQVVRVMCKAIRKSMKSVELKLPPWRRLAYMQNKWLGPYKRSSEAEDNERVRFVAAPVQCREAFVGKARSGIGNLAMVLNN